MENKENINKQLGKIVSFLETKKRINLQNCNLNDCPPTPYIEGSHKTIDETIEYINSLKKDEC